MLQQGNDKLTEAYFHRVQDILESIHHTNNMTSISAIGTNHTKILTGLKDSRLHNKLAESQAKNGPTWCRFCKTLQTWLLTSKGTKVTVCRLLKLTKLHPIIVILLITFSGPPNHLQERSNNHASKQTNLNVDIVRAII